MSPELTAPARRTLFDVLRHPTSQNIAWDDIVRLVSELADVEKREHGRELVVHLRNERLVLRRPEGTPVPEHALLELRRMLENAGIE